MAGDLYRAVLGIGDRLYPTHVDVSPSDVAAEAATIGDRALIDAGAGRIDEEGALAALRLQVLGARRAQAAVDVYRRILSGRGWSVEDLDAATDFVLDPTMRRLSKAAEIPGAFVRLEVRRLGVVGV